MGSKSRAAANGRWGLFGMSSGAVACAILFVVGVLGHMVLEGHSLVDAAYATVGVLTTVGIVIMPTSAASRTFTMILNLASLGVAAMVIGEVGENRKASARSLLRQGGKAPTVASEALQLTIAAVPPVVVGSILFTYFEGWDLFTSLYFSLTCGTGLGMDGSVEPKTPSGRLVFCAYVVIELGVMCSLLNIAGMWMRNAVQSFLVRMERAEHGAAGGKDSNK
jgi:hypothetical protein